jgi:hypothetical protein
MITPVGESRLRKRPLIGWRLCDAALAFATIAGALARAAIEHLPWSACVVASVRNLC